MCARCGNLIKPIKQAKGNILTELVLWLFFLLPGLIYSLWRMTNNELTCPACKSIELVPADSPKGKEMIKKSDLKLYQPLKTPITKKLWFWIVVVIFLFGVLPSMIVSQKHEAPTKTYINPSRINEKGLVVFDIPTLIGKSINGVVTVLGKPAGIDPTQEQINMGITQWDKTFTKKGTKLLVTYQIKNKKIIDFYIETDDPSGKTVDMSRLLNLGNLLVDDPRYKVEFVQSIADPNSYTGVKIIPN